MSTARTPGARTLLPLLGLFVLLGGCGVGEVVEFPLFQIKGVGPEGGVVQGGDVSLVIPPGSLATDTVVSILPQLDPFPILAPDPCTYTYLGPLWCCGPVGQPLAVDGTITVVYDDTLVPAGFTEDDLVLLTWVESFMALEPNFAAVLDTDANTFTLTTYDELGHVAVGIRDCSAALIVFGAFGGFPVLADGAEVEGSEPQSGLYTHSVLPGVPPPQPLPVAFPPLEFVPATNGRHVLYEEFTPSSIDGETSFGLTLMSVPIQSGLPIPIAGGGNEQLTFTGDPFWGWLRNAGGQFAYFEQFLFNSQNNQLVIPNADQAAYSRVIGDGSMPGVPLHGINAATAFTTDLRQSPDGRHMLIRYEDFSQGFADLLDVIESDSEVVLSAGMIPTGNGLFTPRFMPDGMSVYVVDNDQRRARAYPLNWDGVSSPTTLFDIGDNGFVEELLDFIVSPDGGHFAAIVRRDITVDETFQFDDFIYLGDFNGPGGAGQVLDVYNMGQEFFYDEVYMHPNGEVLYIQRGFPIEVVPFELRPDSQSQPMIVEHPPLPIVDLTSLDISNKSGQLLMTLPAFQTSGKPGDGDANALFPSGLCVSDPLGTNITHVDTALGLTLTNARYLFSVRTTPGMRRSQIR